MAVFKCKMCGGDLTVTEGSSICECEYCGSTQTVPSIDDEKKVTLFNRANRLRFNCEFDKAAGVYESIVAEFPEEAEAYWGLVLCKYGIEYVDDPATAKKIPTCHRSSFDSVLDDKDFEMVMEYSDPVSRRVYREEAKQFEDIRRGIIEISGKEDPYDIFICYKETDENGQRTLDSVLAQDIYDALTGKGYRVFFSRVTLEDKLGQEYEPYIFAALHSAKIMLAVGTDYEYYNAVWVKNEWSRYLKLIAAGEKKTLIPCYKGIDAYDMPKEFARLQAQDLGKVGAMQDLMRGIEKIIGVSQDNSEQVQVKDAAISPSVESYLKRIQLYLEDSDWEKAGEYCEKVLDIDPENGQAYVALLLASMKVSTIDQLSKLNTMKPLEEIPAYKKAIRFANEDRGRLVGANSTIKARRAEKEKADKIAAENKAKANNDKEEERAKRCKSASIRLGFEADPEDAKAIVDENKRHAGEIRRLEAELNAEKNTEAPRLQAAAKEREEKEALEVARFNARIASIEDKEGELKREQSTLGLFAGSRKKEIIAELERLTEEKSAEKDKHEASLSEIRADAASTCQNISKNSALVESKIKEENEKHEQIVSKHQKQQKSFGRYPTAKNGSPVPIEWLVLESTDSKALIISKYALDSMRYHAFVNDWEKSTLRYWLNNEFVDRAFSAEEQKRIIETSNNNDPLVKTSFIHNKDTIDRVFLLSVDEAEQYFQDAEKRTVKATEYAVSHRAEVMGNGKSWWWLRTPTVVGVACVLASGLVATKDLFEIIDEAPNGFHDLDYSALCHTPDDYGGAVRPALWISLE